MIEGPATYPMLRNRRRPAPRRRAWLTGRIMRALLALALLGIVAVGIVHLARQAARPDARTAYADGEKALSRGNYSAAHNHFLDAVIAEPRNGRAQAELARTYILQGDGVAAGGALDRAAASGVPADRLHHLRAAALLLQDDADGAIAEADRAGGTFMPYARRVRARAMAANGDRAGAVATLQGVIARDPRDSAAWSDLGRVRLDLGDVAGAGEAAARATAIDGTNLAAWVLTGEVMRSRYGLVAALPWFEAALKRDAYFHPALIEYAGTLGDAGRYADSLAAARAALAARPGSPQALYLMAVIAARASNNQLAADLLDGTGGALNGLPGGLLLSGGLDYAAGRYEQAVAKWRALSNAQPMNLTARRLLGAAMLRSGDARNALAVLRPVALRADADSYTLTLVGRAFEALGQRDWVARFLDRAARVTPGVSAPFGQDDDAAVLADAVGDAPDDPGVAVSYVRGLIESGQWPAALARARSIAGASPGAPAAQVLVGDVYTSGGKFLDAAASYARAADLRFDAPTMLRLVEARALSGDRAGAASVLALYAAQNPESVDARRSLAGLGGADAVATLEDLRADLGNGDWVMLAGLARAYTDAGDPATALGYARAAYRLQPMSGAVADAYGRALFERGDTPGALQLLDKAAAIAPGDAGVRWHRAQALADAGRVPEARDSIRRALADPGFAERDVAAKLLAALPAN